MRAAWKELHKSRSTIHGELEDFLLFGNNLNPEIKKIQANLATGKYDFDPVRGVVLSKKGGSKKRPIRVAIIRDRLLQRAIARKIEPVLSRKFKLYNKVSFAYLKKKKKIRRSLRDAVGRVIELYQERRPFVFEADIEKFFDSVDKNKLLTEMIFPSLPDGSINNLLQGALNQKVGNLASFDDEEQELFSAEGIPQGGALSPLFANIYLSGFDKKMSAAHYGLVRYADDFVVMCKDQEEADRARIASQEILEGELKLKLHPYTIDGSGRTRIIQLTRKPLEFLGVRFDGKRLWPGEKSLLRLREKIRENTEYNKSKTLLEVLGDTRNLIRGWISSYVFTDLGPHLSEIEDILRVRLGECAFRMGWLDRKRTLSDRQRRFSGIPRLGELVLQQRDALKPDEVKLFSKYWTNK